MAIERGHIEAARARIRDQVNHEFDYLDSILDSPNPPPPPPSDTEDGERLLEDARITPYDAQNILAWSITADLHGLLVEPGKIRMEHDKHDVWPLEEVFDGLVYGNCWVIAQGWAATFDWFQRATYTKYLSGEDLAGHIKAGGLDEWAPALGEQVGIFVSTLARHGHRTINERSNVVVVRWPY